MRGSPFSDDYALDPGEVALRTNGRKARSSHQVEDRTGLTGAYLQREQAHARASGRLVDQWADRVEPIPSSEQRGGWLVAKDLGSQCGPVVAWDVRRVREDRIELVGHTQEKVGREPAHIQFEAFAVLARKLQCVTAEVTAGDLQVGALVLQSERYRTASGAYVEHT